MTAKFAYKGENRGQNLTHSAYVIIERSLTIKASVHIKSDPTIGKCPSPVGQKVTPSNLLLTVRTHHHTSSSPSGLPQLNSLQTDNLNHFLVVDFY